MIRGNCDQQISRWHYNPTDQYCHSYQYTGCSKSIFFSFQRNYFFSIEIDGNANSFETEQNCRDICQAKEKGFFRNKKQKIRFCNSIFQRFVHWKKIPAAVINIESCGIMILQVVNVRIFIMVHVVEIPIVLERNKNVKYVVYLKQVFI